jgi:hypothetical protein
MSSPMCRALAFMTLLCATPAVAQDFTSPSANPSYSGISSPAPHSGGILPIGLFDPRKFSISNTLSFGYAGGSGYGGSAGLFVSSLGYQLKSNMALHVNVGAHMNPAFGSNDLAKGIFLEGATFDWKPSTNSLLRVEYRDIRSPLQSWGYGSGFAPSYGYQGLGSPLANDPLHN